MAEIPHFTLPFRFRELGGGQITAVVAEQDSIDDIFSCVELIMSYRKGERIVMPDFGITDLTFSSPDIDADRIVSEVSEWEPRANLVVETEAAADRFDELLYRVKSEVTSRADEAILQEEV